MAGGRLVKRWRRLAGGLRFRVARQQRHLACDLRGGGLLGGAKPKRRFDRSNWDYRFPIGRDWP
jgi:hypothetical protein